MGLLAVAFVAVLTSTGFVDADKPDLATIATLVAWAAFIELSGWICPLTPLEVALRRGAGEAGYGGDFVEHYLVALIYPAGLTRELQVSIGAAVLLINLVVYFVLWRRRSIRRTPG